jgi:CubicO group peptidase (beta-lactamase class C family)
MTKTRVCTTLALCVTLAASASAQATPDFTGIWGATQRFGPDIGGTLFIYSTPDGWRADIAGFTVPVRRVGQSFAFDLPDGKGSLRNGHWIQPGGVATPVTLVPDGPNRFRTTITPLENRLTFYLPITREPDGTLRTYLRNPERNAGLFTRAKRIAMNGADVRLIGPRGGGPDTATLVRGHYEDGVITLPLRGGTYDFTKITDSSSPFYPRGNPPARYHYTPPLQTGDGWPVASLEDVGMSRQAIEQFVQMLSDMPMDSLNTLQIHSLLIARHGKLVLEEYFHGFDRNQPHNLRSASKSMVSVLIGAAMQAGVPLRLDTPVYQTMLGTVPQDLDPRKRAMTLEHLLTMTAGFNCDDSDTTSANEDVMDDRGIEHWWTYTLNVPLVSAPGEKIFYCSTEPHLAGGMLAKVARESQLELFDRLLARPMQMRNYYLGLRDGDAYGGGGHVFTTRDFAKLAQLMVNNGRWNGKQILSADWVRQSTAPLRDLNASQQYGYLWNSVAYDYQGRKIRAYFAGGNGGQVSMGIPDLDLVIAFTGGNYNDAVLFTGQRVYVPRYILPAVR